MNRRAEPVRVVDEPVAIAADLGLSRRSTSYEYERVNR